MPAYVIANVRFANADKAQEYGRQVAATIATFGGRYLARGGQAEVSEGDWQLAYVTIVEFSSLDQAKRWYSSEDYRGLKSLRLEHARTNLAFVDGLAVP